MNGAAGSIKLHMKLQSNLVIDRSRYEHELHGIQIIPNSAVQNQNDED